MRKFATTPALLAAALAAACGQQSGETPSQATGSAGAPDATQAAAPDAPAGPGWMPVELADLEGTPDYDLRLDSPNGGLNLQADFDGDGAADRATLVSDRAAGLYAVRVDTADGRWFIVGEGDIAGLPSMGLSEAPAGTIQTACGKGMGVCDPDEPSAVTLENPGFTLFVYESAGQTFWWNGDGFSSIHTSD